MDMNTHAAWNQIMLAQDRGYVDSIYIEFRTKTKAARRGYVAQHEVGREELATQV